MEIPTTFYNINIINCIENTAIIHAWIDASMHVYVVCFIYRTKILLRTVLRVNENGQRKTSVYLPRYKDKQYRYNIQNTHYILK